MYANARNNVLSLDDIRKSAPSVFATQPWEKMSDNYRFIPTSEVVNGLIANGFQPVAAKQSRTRIEGKEDFTKHVLRFRHTDLIEKLDSYLVPGTHDRVENAPEVPEIVLMNSHDGASSYQISLGFYRLVCSNGLMVCSSEMDTVRVRHSGKEDFVNQVIDATYSIIEDAPKAIGQIDQWKGLLLKPEEQKVFAETALEVRDTALTIDAEGLLRQRRWADAPHSNGERDLWRTMNTIQENLIRGGVSGRDAKGQRRRLRGVNSVDGDTKLNRALWSLAEKMASLKA